MTVAGAPPERLALLRVLVGCFALLYLLVQIQAFLATTSAALSRFRPVGVLSPLHSPVPDIFVVGAYVLGVVAGVGYIVGAAFRVSGPLFGVVLLALTTYRSSWGQTLWLENLMVMHVLIVGLAPSADAISWRTGGHTRATRNPEAYALPVRLAAVVTVATYLVAGVTKLRVAGLDWATTDSLRNHVAATVVRSDLLGTVASPVGRWTVRFGWLFPPMAVAALVLELAAPVALLGGRVRNAWVLLTWLMHGSIAVLMFVVFPYPLFLVAFAPFYELEGLERIWHRWGLDRKGVRDASQLRVRSVRRAAARGDDR